MGGCSFATGDNLEAPAGELNSEPRALDLGWPNYLTDDYPNLPALESLHETARTTGRRASLTSNECFVPVPMKQTAVLLLKTTSTTTANQSAISLADDSHDNAKASQTSSAAIGCSAGVLQQLTTPALQLLESTSGFSHARVRLVPVPDCNCDPCRTFPYSWDALLKFAPKDEAHIRLKICDVANCDTPYGIRRVPDNEHLFAPQLHGRKNIRCRCATQGCTFICERYSDLKRHHAAKHCTNPRRFPCPEAFCTYGGENGFKRLDKLKDHHRKVHQGKLKPTQAFRPIQPATIKPATG